MPDQPPTTSEFPDVEGHAARVKYLPAEQPADVEGHAGKFRYVLLDQTAEVEAHSAGRTLQVARVTLDLLDAAPVTLEAAGPDVFAVTAGLPDVEGHRYRWNAPVPGPEVEAHAAQVVLEPADVEGHGLRWRDPVPAPDVEAHALTVRRITLHPVDGRPIVLEPAGRDAAGRAEFDVAGELPEVEGHPFRSRAPAPGPQA